MIDPAGTAIGKIVGSAVGGVVGNGVSIAMNVDLDGDGETGKELWFMGENRNIWSRTKSTTILHVYIRRAI